MAAGSAFALSTRTATDAGSAALGSQLKLPAKERNSLVKVFEEEDAEQMQQSTLIAIVH